MSYLTAKPQIGRKASQAPLPEVIRDSITGNYVVRYLLIDNEIVILRIWHQRENWKKA